MRKTLSGLLLLLLFSAVSIAVPPSISFQGLLKDSAGNPITGSRTITFNIFPSPSGAGSLWVETQTVTVETGLYNVQLGSVAPITSSVFDGSTRYLAISIGGTELLPRVVLLTVPYSYRAEKADTATYADTAGSSGGIPNAVLYNPVTIQSTTDGNAIWVSSSASGTGIGGAIKTAVSVEATGSNASAIFGYSSNPASTNTYGVAGVTVATDANSAGVAGYAFGSGSNGVKGQAGGTSGIGVYGRIGGAVTSGYGVFGESSKAVGVGGIGSTVGGSFEAQTGIGVRGLGERGGEFISTSGDNTAIWAENTDSSENPAAHAGRFRLLSALGSGIFIEAAGSAAEGDGKALRATISNKSGYAGYFDGGLGIRLPNSDGTNPYDTGSNPTAEGTVRYYGNHFYGWNGTGWAQLDN